MCEQCSFQTRYVILSQLVDITKILLYLHTYTDLTILIQQYWANDTAELTTVQGKQW